MVIARSRSLVASCARIRRTAAARAAAFTVVLLVAVLLGSCAADSAFRRPDPRVIEAYTAGEVSRHARIKVVFTEPVGLGDAGTPLLSFSPRLRGRTAWADPWTLEFVPDEPMRAGERYRVSFEPDAALAETAPGFEFSFHVVPSGVEVYPEGLSTIDPANPDLMEFRAAVTFSDRVDPEAVARAVSAHLVSGGASGSLDIVVDGGRPARTFTVRVPNVVRRADPAVLRLSWDAGQKGLRGAGPAERERGELEVAVPALGSFEVLQVRSVVDQERYVEVIFSEPVSASQNLAGLITAAGVSNLRYSTRSNRVRLYSAVAWPSSAAVAVSPSVASVTGQTLPAATSNVVVFPTEKPAVRFVGEGVIVPTSQGTTVPIETLNLNAVMVEAIRIRSSNVHQFLQVNRLDGENELYRVGEVVWRSVVDLGWDHRNADRWVRYGLDLSPLLEQDPTGLYQLRLTFRRPHVEYPCSGEVFDTDAGFGPLVTGPQDGSYWDSWQEYPPWEYRQYRTDPCHPAYYMEWYDQSITVRRNVMVSDIGLLAKSGQDGRLTMAANDLRSTRPIPGAELVLYNYQRRELARVVTDRDGMARIDLDGEVPFFLVASHAGQLGSLRVDQGRALSVSHFQTAGASVEGGIQGYIYGERGVWRPGDDVYLTFMLYDMDGRLPPDHPVRFEIYDPFGRRTDSRTFTSGVNGVYSYVASTRVDSPTGTWQARVVVGNRTFSRPLRVESVMPNRLKIDLSFPDVAYLSSGPIHGVLEARWLHGASAPGLRADVLANFTPVATRFDGYPGFVFDDPTRDFSATAQTLFDGELDDEGRSEFTARISVRQAPGMLRADLTSRVFEPGGAFSTEYRRVDLHPYDTYVGVRAPSGDAARGMLLTDEEHTAQVVLVDRDGRPAGSGTVRAELFKVDWRWWWESDPENLAAYVSRESLQPLASGDVAVRDGRGSWQFRANYPDWGRYLLRVTHLPGATAAGGALSVGAATGGAPSPGHSAGAIVYIDWPGWAGRAVDEGAGGAAMLVLQPEKPRYQVGEEVTVQLPVSRDGRGLVTIESRGKVLSTEWITGQGPETRYRFRATADMAPNVYLHVTYLQPHLQTANDLPIRTYGVVPIDVEDADTRLTPLIATADRYRPGDEVEIRVSEAGRNSMTYTVALVDEGLLGITAHRTANPWNHFYQRLASGLANWDLYGHVANAFTGTLNTLLAIGGGGEGEDGGRQQTTRFKPVVIFIPPTELRPGATNAHTVTIPQYFGSVRVMVVGRSDRAFGAAEREVPVSREVMVLTTLPRALGVNETIDVPVTVFSTEPGARFVNVSIDTEGPLSVEGPRTQTLRFGAPGEQIHRFTLRTREEAGPALVRVVAAGTGARAVDETAIDVRVPAAPVVSVTPMLLRADERAAVDVRIDGMAGTNRVTLEVSRIPPIDLSRRLSFLIRYPHGCIEQTTSAVFPQLFLPALTTLTGPEVERTQANVRHSIERMALFQTASGGFAYWPGQTAADDWSTTYTGHFLLEAVRHGYSVPQSMLDRWAAHQRDRANSWYGADAEAMLAQAYRLYTLALAREPAYAAMNRLRDADLPDVARWRLAGAYALAGNTSAAMNLVRGADVSTGPYAGSGSTYGSELRDTAMILETLVELGDSRVGVVARSISDALTSDDVLSTQTTAYALLAMARLAAVSDPAVPIDIGWSLNSGPERRLTGDRPVLTEELPVDGPADATLTLRNMTGQQVFPRVIVEGTPAPGAERRLIRGLRLDVTSLSAGRRVDPSSLPSGRDLEIRLAVTNTSRVRGYRELVLNHLLPAGWEIGNDRLAGTGGGAFDYRDIRDDRVYTYFGLEAGATRTFTTYATTAYGGRYYLPMISVESMYEPQIVAVEPGMWITVEGR